MEAANQPMAAAAAMAEVIMAEAMVEDMVEAIPVMAADRTIPAVVMAVADMALLREAMAVALTAAAARHTVVPPPAMVGEVMAVAPLMVGVPHIK